MDVSDGLMGELAATARSCVPRATPETVAQYHEDLADWCAGRGADAEQYRAATVETVRRWRRENRFWPALHDLLLATDWAVTEARDARRRLPAPGRATTGEQWSDRIARLGVSRRRLSALGVAQWRHVMDQHRQRTDAEVLGALVRLEAGRPAWPDHPRPPDPAVVREGLAIVDDDARWPAPQEEHDPHLGPWQSIGAHVGPLRGRLRRLGQRMLEHAEEGRP